jgi:glutaredoxin-like protein NrdH
LASLIERRTRDKEGDFMDNLTKVEGENRARIVLYALSTCGWCSKTKKFLGELGVAYFYVNVDLLSGADKATALKEIEQWNPRVSFPTMVVNDAVAIVGYNTAKVLEAIGNE